MAINPNLETISSGYNISKINSNFQAIDTALQDAVSRSGQAPNQMDADFDMNGNDILNVDNIDVNVLTIDGVPIVPGNAEVDPDALIPVGGLDGQVLTKQSSTNYDVAWEFPDSLTLDNGEWLKGRNAANNADLEMFRINSNDYTEWKNPLYFSDTTFNDRQAVFSIQRNIPTPTIIQPNIWSLVEGKGDNTTFIGVSGGYFQSRDRSDVTSLNKGVLYGLQTTVVPIVDRNNYPYDDVVGLVVSNGGSARGTEGIYIGRSVSGGGADWAAGIGIDSHTSEAAIYVTGSHLYGLDFARAIGSSFSGAAIRLPNNESIVGRNAANSADLDMFRVNSQNFTQWINPMYYDDNGAYVDRQAKFTLQRNTGSTAPSTVIANIYSFVESKGDNASLKGASAGYFDSRDRSDVTGANKGILHGITVNVGPRVARNNTPYDDVAAIVVGNSGTASGTEGIYIGHNVGGGGNDFLAAIGIDSHSQDAAIYVNGTHNYGLDFARGAGATLTTSAIRLPNNKNIVGRNAANSADVAIAKVETTDAVLIGPSTRLLSDGKIILGHTASVPVFTGVETRIQVQGLNSADSSLSGMRWSNDTSGPNWFIAKSRGTSIGTRGIVSANDNVGFITFSGDDGTNFTIAAQIITAVDGTPGTNDMPGRLVFSTTADGASLPTERMRVDSKGLVGITGSLGLGAPVTKTADFTLAATENYIINNKAGSACVATLPTASSWTGRIIKMKTIQAQAINSASSNVVPLAGGAAGTVIVTGTAGRWVELVSDGTNWVAMAGVI
jgi:hypothetical protein